MSLNPVAVLALVSAVLAIAGTSWALDVAWLHMVFKPLTTALIVERARSRGRSQPQVRRWILGGLVLSLVGDVALLWPQRGFLPGLVAFLLAHVAYLVAFTREHRFLAQPAALTAYALVASTVLARCGRRFPPACACRWRATCWR